MALTLPRVTTSQLSTQDPSGFPLEHYSASAMIKFSSNPILFKVEYINRDRFETAMGASGVLGSAVHKALEVYYVGSDELIPTSEAEAIEYGLKAGMEFLELYNDGYINFSKTIPNKQKLFDLLAFCFTSYVQQMPYIPESIISAEEPIKETIDVEYRGQKLTLPVPLKGRLDRIQRTEGRLRIIDYKTCYAYSNPEKIDGAKILQAVIYYLLAYAKYKEEPYSVIFQEVKYTKNSDGTPQVREYEMVFADNEQFFDFFFRFYEDITRSLNGESVYVPNVQALYDNEVAIVAYIHRLDDSAETAKLMKKHKVTNVSDLLKKQIQSAGNMRKLMKSVEASFISAKNLNYEDMTNEQKIQTKMLEHGMMLQFDSKISGPSFDLYRYTPSIGLKMARIEGFVADVEQVLGTAGVRVLAPIPGTSFVGFEVPRQDRRFPTLTKASGFDLAIGETVNGETRTYDLRKAPHMLVAGASGSGKSVFLHSLIKQLMATPRVDLHLFDPKLVEFAEYEGKVKEYETDPLFIANGLKALVIEMNERYAMMKEKGVKNIDELARVRYQIVVVDEFADLKGRESISDAIRTLAQKGRAAGIHIILATQRASTKIVDGDIKINFPVKVVLRVAKSVDSRVMIDEDGAEKLMGMGDLLFATEEGMERLQGYS